MGSEINNELFKRYSREINDIKYQLDQLEKGNIYEQTGARGDGYLATKVKTLRSDLNKLLNKIDNDLPSDNEILSEAFSKTNKDN